MKKLVVLLLVILLTALVPLQAAAHESSYSLPEPLTDFVGVVAAIAGVISPPVGAMVVIAYVVIKYTVAPMINACNRNPACDMMSPPLVYGP